MTSVFVSSGNLAFAQGGKYCTPVIDRMKSLTVTDTSLDKDRFSFTNTINQVLGSMNVETNAENRENFVRTLINSFNAGEFVNPVSGLRMPLEVRDREAKLQPAELLDPQNARGLVPVGLFNRFDLVPNDFTNCGEHRIVYSFKQPIPVTNPDGSPATGTPASRFFLIFEARLDNPQGTGFEGCRPVAEFWRGLSDEADPAKRAARLVDFYYDGIPGVDGPVVQARHYGGPLGQVRGNFFINEPGKFLWQLREWIVINSGQPTAASFVPVTVKDNPFAEFYKDDNPASPNPALEATERAAFHDRFNTMFLTRLVDPEVVLENLKPGDDGYKPELDSKSPIFNVEAYKIEILNRFGARFDNRFNEAQSVSQGNQDNPHTLKGPGFVAGASAALGAISIGADRKPSIEQVVNRAGALTCGGCHQFATIDTTATPPEPVQVGVIAGQPINFPASNVFVQIKEDGSLSPALNDVFLPFRADKLRDAVCVPPEARVAATALKSAATVSQAARLSQIKSRYDQLVATARAEPNAARQTALTQEIVRIVGELRQEEIQKPGFFVTDRRPH